ncbi:zinc finger MYM-type protein 4 isoform X2 [Leptidea sinapis]|uniref:zinc finger MYM-type protein 4 isoform X2 n=1 Tax=Leptidea sinapis TaxID=189913 RepID=UPI0021C4520F|nr:zinc finger MYM-type protein 4 isoform X2 [Leptidea sinapis]
MDEKSDNPGNVMNVQDDTPIEKDEMETKEECKKTELEETTSLDKSSADVISDSNKISDTDSKSEAETCTNPISEKSDNLDTSDTKMDTGTVEEQNVTNPMDVDTQDSEHTGDIKEESMETDVKEANVREESQATQELEGGAENTVNIGASGSKDVESVQKPEFETAPNVSIEDSQDDNTEASDPFDAIMKDTTDATSDSLAKDAATNIDDEEHHQNDSADLDNEQTRADESSTTEEPGSYEEECLLPDTEREISEADKAEAAKVLAEKKKQAEEAAESTSVTKSEQVEPMETNTEANDDSCGNADINQDDIESSHENENGDKETENTEDSEEIDSTTLIAINRIEPIDEICYSCTIPKSCIFATNNSEPERKYFCTEACVKSFQIDNADQYVLIKNKYIIDEIPPKICMCSECEEKKTCYFFYNYDGEDTYYCSMRCLNSMMADEKEKYTYKRRKITVEEVSLRDGECCACLEQKKCMYSLKRYGEDLLICEQPCLKTLNNDENGRYLVKRKRILRYTTPTSRSSSSQSAKPLMKLKVISNATDKYLDEAYKIQAKTPAMVQAAKDERDRTFMRTCAQCMLILKDELMLTWETMDFCNEACLGRFQNKIGSKCANCKNSVQHMSLGKYCVRFGYDIRQFCNSGCLEEFKKGLKICCYCQRDISAEPEGFLAPVGEKGQFKDFCSQACMEKFDQMNKNPLPLQLWAKCAVCSLEKNTSIEIEIDEDITQRLCSEPCFAAFKFVNNICPDQCSWCKKHFERKLSKCFTVYENGTVNPFCSKSCMNIYISNTRHIVPCSWCKVKKYNYDMIQKTQAGAQVMMCSLNCLNLYQVSMNAVSSRRTKCDMCRRTALAQYHLTMSDATVRNFCTYQCVISFQGQYSKHSLPIEQAAEVPKAVPTGAPRRTYNTKSHAKSQARGSGGLPVISNVQSLATPPPIQVATPPSTRGKSKRLAQAAPPPPEPEPPQAPKTPPPPPKPLTPPPPPPPKIYNHVIVKTLPPNEVANKGTMTKPMMVSKGVSCRPHPCTKECQTDSSLERKVLIPVPVPIYVPVPCVMWSLPFPVPVPIPLPIPTPVFIPTTRNSAKGIMKEINKIHDKMPTDPFEAELLMMAEMVAGDKKKDQSDSETDDENAEEFSPVAGMEGSNAFGEDMLQMALKMATEYEVQPVDLESAMTANTITPSSHPGMPGLENEGMHHHHMMMLEQRAAALRGAPARKRVPPAPPAAPTPPRASRAKRRRDPQPPPPEPPREPAEKPDANMCLKYTFGVNAWKQWVMTKNAEIEKSSVRRKPFKSEILQLTADELNYSLCLFVKEVRKPNGSEYAPDTIYYLVLGIQQYLFENGRIDNIFTDPYYEKFTDCLDEVARKFSVLYNDSQYIVTRVEEEHLWESKQLGAHSPHVLLSTLMFFNTKHFNLVTVDEHMQLSFSHIMKHWKRNPNQPGQAKIPGARNVLLRFYPPQSALEANSRKKKVYEQQENEENPLRCPVKLYEFYISKW